MKRLSILCFLLFSGLLSAQVITDDQGFQTFEMRDGDTTYIMKQYFMVFLKSGTVRSQSEEESAKIQAGHLAHMDSLAAADQLDIAGPFGDDGEIRGIVVLRVPTMEAAVACCEADPAVRANRLSYEIHPWWAAVGSRLR